MQKESIFNTNWTLKSISFTHPYYEVLIAIDYCPSAGGDAERFSGNGVEVKSNWYYTYIVTGTTALLYLFELISLFSTTIIRS